MRWALKRQEVGYELLLLFLNKPFAESAIRSTFTHCASPYEIGGKQTGKGGGGSLYNRDEPM